MKAATIFGGAFLIVGFVIGLPHYECPDGQEAHYQPLPPTYETSCRPI